MSEFTIPSSENLPIRGNLDLPKNARALVVVAHGFKGFKDWGFFPWLAEYLHARRFAVCRFNMSRSGIGDNPEVFDRLDLFEHDTYSAQISDLLAVAEHAQKKMGPIPTFLLGHSRGGAVALLAAGAVAHLHGIVTWSAIARADRWDDETKNRWRAEGSMESVNQRTRQVMRMSTAILDDYEAQPAKFDVLAAAARLRVPLLVLHGSRDESVPVSEAHEIAAAAPDASKLILATAGHTYNAIHPLVHVPPELTYAAAVTASFVSAYA